MYNKERHCMSKVENFRLPGDVLSGITTTLREEIRGEGFGPLYEAPSILSRVPSEYSALEFFPLSLFAFSFFASGVWAMSAAEFHLRRVAACSRFRGLDVPRVRLRSRNLASVAWRRIFEPAPRRVRQAGRRAGEPTGPVIPSPGRSWRWLRIVRKGIFLEESASYNRIRPFPALAAVIRWYHEACGVPRSRVAARERAPAGRCRRFLQKNSEKGVDMRADLPYLCAPVRPERNSPKHLTEG